MTTFLPEPITLPQGRRSRGGLLDSAEALPEGWENGIAFRTTGCVEPEILGPCEIGDTVEVRPGDAIFTPVYIRQSAACALMSQVGTVNIAENRLEGTTEWALGRSLVTGVLSENPSFEDSESVHLFADATGNIPLQMVDLVSCLEQAVADVAYGTEAFLHAPLRAAAYLRAANLVDRDGLSPSGFRWIISPGYPVGETTEDGTTLSLWATGTVWASVTAAEPLLDGVTGQRPVNWRMNLDAAYAQRLGMAAFDPCLNLTASLVVPACNGES
jgi:hypothetical protein